MVFDRKAWTLAYREKNKEKIAQQQKANHEKNKERIAEKMKEWRQTESYTKSYLVSTWKHRGVIHDDYSALYDVYIATTHCQACSVQFKDSFDRCLDHDHDTGLFRQFLCRACNIFDRWEKQA
jgi:hypothetical protein